MKTIEVFDMLKLGELTASATFSDDERKRFGLYRRLEDPAIPRILFVMLNPSTADAFVLDRTVSKCCRFARTWGYGHLEVCNLFALRSTDPRALYAPGVDLDEDGENAAFIASRAELADMVVCAWGTHGALKGRGVTVANLLEDTRQRPLTYLRLTKGGFPEHPLYLPKTCTPQLWLRER